MTVSVNKKAMKIVQELLSDPEFYNINVEQLASGSTIIDTGLEAAGGYMAGLKLTEIAIGGLGKASISVTSYNGLVLPTVFVATDYPAVSLFGSQLAGWSVKVGDFSAMGSGPARALALKPKKVFEKIKYRDYYNQAVLLLETKGKPTDEVAIEISEKCGVKPNNLYLVLTTVNSLSGSVQVSGRVVETGLYRLDFLGLDPLKVTNGVGYAPIMPVHPSENATLGREEDALIYGGVAYFTVEFDDDKELRNLVEAAPAAKSKDYGKTSYERLKSINFDWSKLDPAFFAVGSISVHNRKSGKTHSAGSINQKMLKESVK
jgi:methenyltetrahydromethanopterin cyclohydrolase